MESYSVSRITSFATIVLCRERPNPSYLTHRHHFSIATRSTKRANITENMRFRQTTGIRSRSRGETFPVAPLARCGPNRFGRSVSRLSDRRNDHANIVIYAQLPMLSRVMTTRRNFGGAKVTAEARQSMFSIKSGSSRRLLTSETVVPARQRKP